MQLTATSKETDCVVLGDIMESSGFSRVTIHYKRRLLEQPEEFEDDHDNDNHSNYVKDVSTHDGYSYQPAPAMVNICPNLPATTRRFPCSENSPND
jgi:hypothetical protein